MNFLYELKEGLIIAWTAIRANKLRSVLTTLGIVIGIVTVTLMGTAIAGFRASFLTAIAAFGTDVFHVQRFSWFYSSEEDWRNARKRQPITGDQVEELSRNLLLSGAVAPVAQFGLPVAYGDRKSSGVRVIGTTDKYLQTSGTVIADGRFFSGAESSGGRPVCVIGANVASNLFLTLSPLGETIRVGDKPFNVVGVLVKQGGLFGDMGIDDIVILPLEQLRYQFWSNPDLGIQVKVGSLDRMDEAKEEMRGAFRKIRRVLPGEPDDFAINQQEQFLEAFNRVLAIIGSAGLFVTGLSLFVGGIGIMNIMFVSVAERTREIGIRKAIGAKRRVIMTQFLTEAAVICLIGGLIGLAISFPISLALKSTLGGAMPWSVMLIAVIVSLFTGLASGFFPAWRAAKMDPVEALRSE
jgi:putative ABC transport system permease protein